MKKFLWWYVAVVVLLIMFFWAFGSFFKTRGGDVARVFTINSNESVVSISRKLSNDGFINSPFSFFFYSLVSGNFSRLQPGGYLIPSNLNIREVISRLSRGPDEVSVTLYPGITLKETDRVLSRAQVIKSGELEKFPPVILENKFSFLRGATTLEGFIFPDTYRFHLLSDAQEVAVLILSHFEKKIKNLPRPISLRTVIVASLLEKEVVSLEEKELVAGIIERRLLLSMPLQIDASVLYGICEGVFSTCGQKLSVGSFVSNSPYNTYRFQGLPPSPIGSPGLESLQAASAPRASRFLYYLSDSRTKKSYFSETFEEHNEKRFRYLGL